MKKIEKERLATIVTLVERKPRIGRTALMKLCYFLQTLRNVPLEYRFTLYSYGPFDSNVLSDLDFAESFGGLQSDIILHSNGYTYEIAPSNKSDAMMAWAADFIKYYENDFNWVVDEFGNRENGDLELLSTIVYVDRESEETNERLSPAALIQKVNDVKPQFEEPYVIEKVKDLANMDLLQSLRAISARSSAA
jgi:uncharacterized protein YwgA